MPSWRQKRTVWRTAEGRERGRGWVERVRRVVWWGSGFSPLPFSLALSLSLSLSLSPLTASATWWGSTVCGGGEERGWW
jgi:hypothetical protein